ncbi:MAG: NTP transferase domain-containing protein [Wenzhouxiangellaceae bacterium]
MNPDPLHVIVLAGDRGPGDPLARSAGVPGKVLVEIGRKPMLTRVLQAVAGFDRGARIVLVCRDSAEYAAAADIGHSCLRVDPADSPAASVAAALKRIDASCPVLLVTGDHPLLQPAWLEQFVERARASGADAVVGVVDHGAIVARFPGNRRTRYRFSDIAVCGTNLFYVSGKRGRRVAHLWPAFEADRKRPWKIVGRLGGWNLLRYLLGRLTLEGAMKALSCRMQLRLAAVLIDWPEAAVDVDSPEDLVLVTRLIESRGEPAS